MPPYATFMLIFAAAILFYALILAFTKDEHMLPLIAQASIKHLSRKKKEAYLGKLAKAIALVALAPAISAVMGIWSEMGMLITFVLVLVLTLWLSTRIVKDEK